MRMMDWKERHVLKYCPVSYTHLVSHPSKGHLSDSMINGVQAYFENEGREKNERSNIHLIGRLDKETSGILGIAKNSVTAERMIKQRQRGILIKEYYALVKGNPPEEGILEIPMEEMRDCLLYTSRCV